MEPVKYKLTCYQGTTFSKPFIFKDINDNITNLTGYTARMQVRPTIDSETVIIELTTENDRVIIDGEFGKVTLFISDEDTADLTPGSYVYDLELVTGSGRVYRPLYGAFKIVAEVTR